MKALLLTLLLIGPAHAADWLTDIQQTQAMWEQTRAMERLAWELQRQRWNKSVELTPTELDLLRVAPRRPQYRIGPDGYAIPNE